MAISNGGNIDWRGFMKYQPLREETFLEIPCLINSKYCRDDDRISPQFLEDYGEMIADNKQVLVSLQFAIENNLIKYM